MTHRKKILSLLLALVMLLGFSTSALAADTEIEGRLQITKIVQTQEENVPETEFTFALRDPDGRALADYGITVTQNTLTANASASCYLTFTADTDKITEETGWEPVENGYHHVFELTEENTGAAGWSYDPAVYMLDIVYSAGDLFIRSYRESVAEGNNCDVVFHNAYEPVATVEIPFVKNVVQGGNTAPGQQLFELEIFDIGNSNTDSYANVTCTARVETNGAGTYNGNIVISGPTNQVQEYICEGFFVREKNTGAADWTYSDAVYLVFPYGTETEQGFGFYPAEYTTSENGEYYLPAEQPVDTMVFENTYTHNIAPVPVDPPVETPADTIRLPQTGDGSNVVFLLFAAGFGFAGAIWILRKKEALNR